MSLIFKIGKSAGNYFQREGFALLFCFIRSAATLAVIITLMSMTVYKRIHGDPEITKALVYLAAMDIYRKLFYGLVPVFLFILLPLRPIPKLGRSGGAVFSAVLGSTLGALPWIMSRAAQHTPNATRFFFYATTLTLLNLVLFIYLEIVDGKHESLRKVLRYAFGFSDFLFPAPLLLASVRRKTGIAHVLRLLPAVQLCLPCLWVVLLYPPPQERLPPLPREARLISTKTNGVYNIQADPKSNSVWTTNSSVLFRIGLDNENPFLVSPYTDRNTTITRYAYDPANEDLLITTREKDVLTIERYDSTTLRSAGTEKFQLKRDINYSGSSVTLYDGPRGILAAVFEGILVRFSADGKRITRLDSYGGSADAILDPNRRLIYISANQYIAALDADTLEMRTYIPAPNVTGWMAMDACHDRLFVAYPLEGVVRVIDLRNFRLMKTLRTAYGVRVIAYDPEWDLVFTGGFSPFLEMFSGSDLALVNRVHAPPWQRSILPRPDRNSVLIATVSGVWEIPLAPMDRSKSVAARIDPFFFAQHLFGGVIRLLSGQQFFPDGRERIFLNPTTEEIDCPSETLPAEASP